MSLKETIQNNQVVRAYRQGWLAWLGANKAAFDMAQDGVSKLMNSREELLEDLIQKGESVEDLAQENVKKVRAYVEPRVSTVTDRVANVRTSFFTRSTDTADRVALLSEEVAKLSKSVSALNRKVTAAAPAKKTTTAKKPVKKAASKAAEKTEAPKAETTAPAGDKAAA